MGNPIIKMGIIAAICIFLHPFSAKYVYIMKAMEIWVVLNSMEGHKIRKSFPQKWLHFKEKFIFLEMDKHWTDKNKA